MRDCIFTAHCTELRCDKSCPMYAETSYLLERNGLQINNPVFRIDDPKVINKTLALIDSADEEHQFISRLHLGSDSDFTGLDNTVQAADLITYCAICKHWKGSKLHCTVYNLKFSKFIDLTKKSWSGTESDELQYMRIWAESAKVLVVSNMDYISFGDFESQTLLNLLQSRQSNQLSTIFVTPQRGLTLKTNSQGMASEFSTMLNKVIRGGSST